MWTIFTLQGTFHSDAYHFESVRRPRCNAVGDCAITNVIPWFFSVWLHVELVCVHFQILRCDKLLKYAVPFIYRHIYALW